MMDTTTVERFIREGESVKVEFKGERHEAVSDRDIYEAVVCLANAEGGIVLIGVEDDGTVTGAHPRHGQATDPIRLQAAIFNNTEPPINTRVSIHTVNNKPVIAIEVDPYPEICATKEGKSLRRVMGMQGPECRPFYPHEHRSRLGDLGLLDYSAQIVAGARWEDLDPLEFERLRQTIQRRRGDAVLLGLDDRQFAQALQLVESRDGELVPNVAGLLLLGRTEALRRFVPTHEVAFQVLDGRGNVVVNDFFYSPLLKTLEAVEQRFSARNQEREVQVGFIRLPIPDYAPEAFREAVNNSVLHRDYTRRGAVYIQFQPDHLFISNPGGFLEGITLDNLLVHEPKPRNPRLADAFRRIGLVEKTGRGIDKIYLGQLWYGRPLPDYSQSDRESVRLTLHGGATSLEFAAFVYEQDKAGKPLSLDELLVLNQLQHERRIDAPTVGRLTQRGEAHARAVLERLVERDLIEPRGEKRGRVYHLSAPLYRRLGMPAGYVRAHGFDPIRQEAMIMEYVAAHGRITRREVADLCSLGDDQASRLLRRLVANNRLALRGKKRGAYYELSNKGVR
jgi:ATP-dependent DNA helicase RecG